MTNCGIWNANKYSAYVHLMFSQPLHQIRTHTQSDCGCRVDPHVCKYWRGHGTLHEDNRARWVKYLVVKLTGRGSALFSPIGRRVVGWLFGGESMLGWPWAINRRLSQPSAASLIYGAPPIAPGFIWPLSNTCSVTEHSPALAGPLCILNNPDGNCPFLKC